MKKLPKKSGFTLIELLVVVAIIGLLSSVVLASLRVARSRAQDTKVLSDMSQMQKALELYAADNAFQYPVSGADLCLNTTNLSASLVPKYIGSIPKHPALSSGQCYKYYSDGTVAVVFGAMTNEKYAGTQINKQTGVAMGTYSYAKLKQICATPSTTRYVFYPIFDVTVGASLSACYGVESADRILGITDGKVVASGPNPGY